MNRRFVNLLVDQWRSPRPAFKLHRINPAGLFYPTESPRPAEECDPAPRRLPSPSIAFDSRFKRHQAGWMDFMAFKNTIVAVDHEGRTVLYDCASRSILATNPMQPAVQSNNTLAVTVGDSLYVMSSHGCLPSRLVRFTALIYGKPTETDSLGQDDWYWRSLQLPPFEYADRCSDDAADCYSRSGADFTDGTIDDEDSTHPCAISAFTVVGDSQIWVSTVAAGTYSFDTASREWSKVGAWALPFRGRAVYIPEHGLWFGFSDEGYQLCAAELALTQAPVLHRVWQDPAPPEYLRKALMLTAARLLPLGSGKLCVARLFDETDPEYYETFAVVSGVEVRRGAGVGDCLLVVNHKSRRYIFGSCDDVRLL